MYIRYIALLCLLSIPIKGISDVYIVYDHGSEIMKQEAVSISKAIPESKILLIGDPIRDDKEDSRIIAIGDKAVEYSIVERNKSCIIAAYIPSIAYYKLMEKYALLSSNNITAIFIDPSVNYQLELIKQLYPHNPSAIVFVDKADEYVRRGLEESSKEQGVNLEIISYLNDKLMLLFSIAVKCFSSNSDFSLSIIFS